MTLSPAAGLSQCMATAPTSIVVDVRALAADAATVDTLARLQLNACRIGQRIELRGASPALERLIAFCGLDQVLPVEPRREAEEREEPLGVEEERELPDATA